MISFDRCAFLALLHLPPEAQSSSTPCPLPGTPIAHEFATGNPGPTISKEIEGGGAFFLPSPVGEGGPRRGSPKTRYEFLGVHGKRWMRRTPVSCLNCLLWRREHRDSPPSQRRGARQAPVLQGKSRKKAPLRLTGGRRGVRGADKGGGEPQERRQAHRSSALPTP